MARETVKLVSAEGFEFIVDYKAACVSNTIKNMLSSQGDPQPKSRLDLAISINPCIFNHQVTQAQKNGKCIVYEAGILLCALFECTKQTRLCICNLDVA